MMSKRTVFISLILSIIFFMNSSVLWAQEKAIIAQKKYDTTTLMKTTKSDASSLKQLIDSLSRYDSQNRLTVLKKIVVKANTLLNSVKKLQTEVAESGKLHLNESHNKAMAQNLADLSTQVKNIQSGLIAGSVDFAANCNESSSCLEAPCAACCRAKNTDPIFLDLCLQSCRSKADLCKARELLMEAMEAQTQNVHSMSAN